MQDLDFADYRVLAKADRPSNSGYLSTEYQECNVFPDLEEHHFRIEDDQTILELQRLYNQSKPQQVDYQQQPGSEFHRRMNSLITLLDANRPVQMKPQGLQIGKVFYTLQDTSFDPQEAYKSLVDKAEIGQLQQGIGRMVLEESEASPEPVKFKKRVDGLTVKMNKLDIQQY